MKLIAEYIDNQLEVITEAKDGVKVHMIEGIFAQAEQPNRNRRVYPRAVMENAVGKYVKEQVSQNRAVGELNHPEGPSVNLDKVSHLITELKWVGDDVIGKATILNTPNGMIVKGLLDGGVRLGVSTRGMGSLGESSNGVMIVKDDYILNTVDIVQDPSAPTAFVNGIFEGMDWVWNNGIIESRAVKNMETEIINTPRKFRYETQIREYKNFLSLLKTKTNLRG